MAPDANAADSDLATILKAMTYVPAAEWSCLNKGVTLTLRVLENGEGHKDVLLALKPAECLGFQMSDGKGLDPIPAAAGEAPRLLAVALTEGEERRELFNDGVLIRLRRANLLKLADAMGKRQRLDVDLPDKTLLRVRWVRRPEAADGSAGDTRRRAPDRDEVPIPSPTFAAGEKWTMYTTPFPYPRTPPPPKEGS